ncbi:TPA: chemotaxis protein CheA, partial [Burkholderia multivorans]|nr:chemotaxis protein CheA [Burkholderia multivorans]HEM8497293.1 chemotaxis protein CheA [Burkholderia multivorans]
EPAAAPAPQAADVPALAEPAKDAVPAAIDQAAPAAPAAPMPTVVSTSTSS